jgi:hypothetical protein
MTWHTISVLVGKGALLWGSAALLLLAWLVPHRGFHWVRGPARWLLDHPRLAAARGRSPRLAAFLHRHLVDRRRSWVRLAVGSLVSAGAIFWFWTLLHGVLTDGKLVNADQCLHNTVCRFHSPALLTYYSLVSNLASTAFVLPLVVIVAGLFAAGGRRREAIGLCLGLAGAIGLAVGLKQIVERPRPPGAAELLGDSSFPSGHTLVATSVFGLLVYLLLRDSPRGAWRRLAALPLLVLIASVPVSRSRR